MANNLRKLKNGLTVEDLHGDAAERIHRLFPPYKGLIKLQPAGWLFPSNMPDILDDIYDFKFRSTDVVTMTFPKSGTTWSQEILWSLVKNPNLDNPEASLSTDFRAPHIEADMFLVGNPKIMLPADHKMRQITEKTYPGHGQDKHILFAFTVGMPSPRVIKTHLPFSLLPGHLKDKTKVLYTLRDPRDIIISRFHWFKLMKVHDFQGTFDEFIDLFLEENMILGPYFKHVKEALDNQNHLNVFVLYYEDLKSDPFAMIRKISDFIGLDRTDEQIQRVTDYTSFSGMKKRSEDKTTDAPMEDDGRLINADVKKETGGFFRKGKSGDWKDNFNPEQVKKIENWITKNTLDFPADFRYRVQ